MRQGERLLRDLSPETLGSLDGCLKRETMRTYATNCLQDYLFSYQEFGEPKVAALLEGEQKTGNTLEDFVRVQVRKNDSRTIGGEDEDHTTSTPTCTHLILYP